MWAYFGEKCVNHQNKSKRAMLTEADKLQLHLFIVNNLFINIGWNSMLSEEKKAITSKTT